MPFPRNAGAQGYRQLVTITAINRDSAFVTVMEAGGLSFKNREERPEVARVQAEIPAELVGPLLEFGKALARIEADVVVLMARKALCLYDLLLRLGVPPIERPVVSSRILENDLQPLRGKRIALVDDTLILGSTLLREKQRLEREAQAKVSIHVFMVDRETWGPAKLIEPTNKPMMMSPDEVVDFCFAEVRAFSLLPRPYQVDFPQTVHVPLTSSQMGHLLCSVEWSSYETSTALQQREQVYCYTFFPKRLLLREWQDRLGGDFAECLQIAKVRVFAVRNEVGFLLRFVPMVTLKALRESDVDLLLGEIIARIGQVSGKDLSRLLQNVRSPKPRQRLLQFCLSLSLLARFEQSFQRMTGTGFSLDVDREDALRQYGPWLESELEAVISATRAVLWPAALDEGSELWSARPARDPTHVLDLNERFIAKQKQTKRKKKKVDVGPNPRSYESSVIADLADVFLSLYRSREVPFREDVKLRGRAALDDAGSKHLGRLTEGLTWTQILTRVQLSASSSSEPVDNNLASLALDVCVDMGVAVPITCYRNGVVYRAYRHGESVRFGDRELELAQFAIQGLLTGRGDAAHQASIPHTLLEKLLVLLIKVGAAQGMLVPFHGTTGRDGTMEVSWHLHGAVAKSGDSDLWLSNHLLRRDIIVGSEEGGYRLNRLPDQAVPTKPKADAFRLGRLVGRLSMRDGQGALDVKDFIVLTSCPTPCDATGAIATELKIFRDWWVNDLASLIVQTQLEDAESLESARRQLIRGRGHIALHSALMKCHAYGTSEANTVLTKANDFFRADGSNVDDLLTWQAYTRHLPVLAPDESDTFRPRIEKMAAAVWDLISCLSALEAILSTNLAVRPGRQVTSPAHRAMEKLDTATKKLACFKTVPSVVVRRCTTIVREAIQDSPTMQWRAEHLDPVMRTVADLLPKVEGMSERSLAMVQEFRRRPDFQYEFTIEWDIEDSAGSLLPAKGVERTEYFRQRDAFQRAMNLDLPRQVAQAEKDGGEIYIASGRPDDPDDGKRLFIRGDSSNRYVEEVLYALADALQVNPLIHLRIFVVRCSFSGGTVSRYQESPTMHGREFLTYLARFVEWGKRHHKSPSQAGRTLLYHLEPQVESIAGEHGRHWPRYATENVSLPNGEAGNREILAQVSSLNVKDLR